MLRTYNFKRLVVGDLNEEVAEYYLNPIKSKFSFINRTNNYNAGFYAVYRTQRKSHG